MKKLFYLSIFFTLLYSFSFYTKTEVQIKSSVQCGMCKSRIEEELNYVKGIQFVNVDVTSKLITIRFNPEKITVEDIKIRISKIGYDADEVKAVTEAVNALPSCCKPGSTHH